MTGLSDFRTLGQRVIGAHRARGLAATLALISLLLGAASFVIGADDDLSDGLERAFSQTIGPSTIAQASASNFSGAIDPSGQKSQRLGYQPPLVGSEDFWLGHASDTPAATVSLTGPMEVGDELTLSINGQPQVFEVTGVSALASGDGRRDGRQSIELTSRRAEASTGRTFGPFVIRLTLEVPRTSPAGSAGQLHRL